MPDVEIECNYCGNKWEETYYFNLPVFICSVCKDKSVSVRQLNDSNKDVFGYGLTKKKDAYIK